MTGFKLKILKFTAKMLDDPRLQGFYCGKNPCQEFMAQWIRDRDEVIQALRGWKIFIYESTDGKLVGYGSLNKTSMILPTEYGYGTEQEKVIAIPTLAVDKNFWGEPKGESEEKYSHQIMRHLIEGAKSWRQNSTKGDIQPCLALAVHPLNRRARKYYLDSGFKELPPNPNDTLLKCPATGVELLRMLRSF